MADSFTKEKRSWNMSRIRSSGTAPELRLGELLRNLFRGEEVQERPALPGKPDYVIPRLGLAVFCDGCFWHGCPRHYRIPGDNHEYWEAKIQRNRARDRKNNRELRKLGIRPVRVWEHELGKDLASARRKLRRAARETAKVVVDSEGGEIPAPYLVRRKGKHTQLKPGDVFIAGGRELAVVSIRGNDLHCREATDEEAEGLNPKVLRSLETTDKTP